MQAIGFDSRHGPGFEFPIHVLWSQAVRRTWMSSQVESGMSGLPKARSRPSWDLMCPVTQKQLGSGFSEAGRAGKSSWQLLPGNVCERMAGLGRFPGLHSAIREGLALNGATERSMAQRLNLSQDQISSCEARLVSRLLGLKSQEAWYSFVEADPVRSLAASIGRTNKARNVIPGKKTIPTIPDPARTCLS